MQITLNVTNPATADWLIAQFKKLDDVSFEINEAENWTLPGRPMTPQELEDHLAKIEAHFIPGKGTTLEMLEREMQEWI